MALEPLPPELRDFSIIAMDMDDDVDTSLIASICWPQLLAQDDYHRAESAEEARQRLAAATAELETVREEVRRKHRNIASLEGLIRRTAQERDLLREQQHHLLLARDLQGTMTPSSGGTDSGRTTPPIPSSSSSPATVAADRSPLFKVPSSAGVVQEERSLLPSPAAADRTAMFKPGPAAATAEGRSRAAALPVPSFAAIPGENNSAAAAAAAQVGLPPAQRQLVLHRSPASFQPSSVAHGAATVVDNGSAAAAAHLELLAAKRPLPRKGRLVQAVMEAGPLLENLMVAGPLPRWRNPPPVLALTNAMVSAPSSSGAQMILPWSPH